MRYTLPTIYSVVVKQTDTVDTKDAMSRARLWGSSDLPSTVASRALTITL